jgi:WD40 repeat protein
MVWEGVDPLEDLESWSIMHGRGVVAVAISADARVVATADKDKTLRMWDAEERTPLQVWSAAHRWQSTAIAVGPEGERVASASRTEVSVFQVGEKERVTQLGPHKAEVTTVAFHGDGERLVTGDADGVLYLWDVEGAEVLMEWRGHEAAVTSVAFVDEGETLVSGDADGVVYAWRSDRRAGRYKRWEEHARTPLRLEGILRSFGGDLELARAGLLAGVGGLSSADPAVLRLLEILEAGEEESVGGE